MNPLHLLWIVPLCVSVGCFAFALLAANHKPLSEQDGEGER
jgi:hypothetical protein